MKEDYRIEKGSCRTAEGRKSRLAQRVGAERAVVLLDRIAEATMPKAKEKEEEKKNAI